jgi:glycosyltransferase involved in cell wall biosynthesis
MALVETIRLFRRLQPAVVHTHMSKAGMLGRLAARLAGVPSVVHSARRWPFCHAPNSVVESAYVGIERFLVRFTDCTLGVSAATVEEGLSHGIGHSDQYRVVRSGIDLAPFRSSLGRRVEVRAALGVQPDTPLVGTVAEISAAKAPYDYIAIVQRIHDAMPEARFVWAGTGPMKDEVQAEATRAGLDGVLTWLGQREDVAPLYNAFDVYLLPSHFEGLSRTVVEALCSGVPVVTTRVGGHEEVLQHGNQGWLAAPGAVNVLADHVLSLLKEPDLRARMAANALQTDLDCFGLDAVVGAHEALYRELLSGHPVR